METNNLPLHHRKTIRLNGYDYSQQGNYFVTICVQNRECLFGEIKDGIMYRNDSGEMISSWITEITNKFRDVIILSSIVMPNHVHAIISNANTQIPASVGADLRVCPVNGGKSESVQGEHIGSPLRGYTGNGAGQPGEHIGSPLHEYTGNGAGQPGEHIGSPLQRIIQWFKTMTTNEYIKGVKTSCWKQFDRKLWQRNYYEHIIRNEQTLNHIDEYIRHNPQKWYIDKLYREV